MQLVAASYKYGLGRTNGSYRQKRRCRQAGAGSIDVPANLLLGGCERLSARVIESSFKTQKVY